MKICPPIRKLRVLDIGCGEGKDAVFFARNGYIVDAFDIAIVGVEKTKYLADEMGVSVNAFQANLLDYRLEHWPPIILTGFYMKCLNPYSTVILLESHINTVWIR